MQLHHHTVSGEALGTTYSPDLKNPLTNECKPQGCHKRSVPWICSSSSFRLVIPIKIVPGKCLSNNNASLEEEVYDVEESELDF